MEDTTTGNVPVAQFRLSVTAALRDQLNRTLGEVTPSPLTQSTVDALSRRGGVYELFYAGELLVYIGKATKDLPRRLTNHVTKLGGRVGPPIDRVTFRCVYVDEDLHAVSAEKLLIDQHRAAGEATWNVNGFGNNDPGKRRDSSLVKTSHFDRLFPIDMDLEVALPRHATVKHLGDVMHRLKGVIPYTFRFLKKGPRWDEVRSIELPPDEVPQALTVREWMAWLAGRLPATWTLIALPGYLIGYPHLDATTIGSRTGSWRRVDSEVVFDAHDAQFEEGAVPDKLNIVDGDG